MKAIVLDVVLNSLFSIRVPYTWQSALSHPLPPPSTIIGMLSNALQRYRNDRHPVEYLDVVEGSVVWVGSRLITPAVIKSYITSAITKWELPIGGKSTNVLGRQFVSSKRLRIISILRDSLLVEEITDAVKVTPLTCGDSESPLSVEKIEVKDVSKDEERKVLTEYPLPFNKEIRILEGNGRCIWCMNGARKRIGNSPL